jgi:hypothetical protein
MTQTVEGDEPPRPDNLIYTLRGGAVTNASGEARGSYADTADGYRIMLGASVCAMRALGTGAINTLTGVVDHGDLTDPVATTAT